MRPLQHGDEIVIECTNLVECGNYERPHACGGVDWEVALVDNKPVLRCIGCGCYALMPRKAPKSLP